MATLMRWDPFALVRTDPFQGLLDLQRDMNRIMAGLGTPARLSEFGPMAMGMSMDVLQRDEDLVIRAEMPGVLPENIDISIAEGRLTIKGERYEDETRHEDYVVREMGFGIFERTMSLPEGVDPATIRAEYREGILEVTLPHARRLAEPRALHIPIETHCREPDGDLLPGAASRSAAHPGYDGRGPTRRVRATAAEALRGLRRQDRAGQAVARRQNAQKKGQDDG